MNGFTNLNILLRMQFASLRWFWASVMVNSFVIPLSFLVIWYYFADGVASTDTMIYFLAGNITLGLLFGNMNRVASRFAFLKDTGALDYYATLLTNKTLLIFSVTLVFLLVSLPGVIAGLFAGIILLDVPISIHPMLAVALILGSFSLSTMGAVIGVFSRSFEQSLTTTQLITLGMMVLSPVFVEVDRLPRILQWTSYLVPTTYTVRAVRDALISDLGVNFWLNLAILVLFNIGALWAVHRRMEWRA